jgi:hypothetical protein
MDNSIILQRRLFLVWLINGGPRDFKIFCEHVYWKAAGDDSIIAVTSFGFKFINPTSMSSVFKKHWGCDLEFAEQLEFLGHYFVLRGSEYRPAFSHDRLVATLAYRGGISASDSLEVACNSRMEAYSNPESLALVDGYIDYLVQKYPELKDQYCKQFPTNDKIDRMFCSTSGFKLHSRTKAVPLLLPMSEKVVIDVKPNTQAQNPSRTAKRNRRRRRRNPANPPPSIKVVPQSGQPNAFAYSRSTRRGQRQTPQGVRGNYAAASCNTEEGSQVKLACAYSEMLLDPRRKMVRMPDSTNKQTALARSEIIVDVYADPTISNGAFSTLIKPQLGSTALLKDYKVANVKAGTNYATADWTSKAVYDVTQLGNGQVTGSERNIAVDPFQVKLTQQPPGALLLLRPNPVVASTQPYGPTLVVDPTGESYGIGYTYSTPDVNTSRFVLEPGQYSISSSTTCTVASGANSNVTFAISVGGQIRSQNFSTAVTGLNQITARSAVIVIPSSGGYLDIISAALGAGQYTNATIEVNRIYSPGMIDDAGAPMRPPLDSGDASGIRTVAMCALWTSTTAPLYTGGVIAANRLEGGQAERNFFSTGTAKQLQNYKSLATTPKAMDGKIGKGAYVWWAPEDNDDWELKAPSVSLSAEMPTICFSGLYQPPNPVAGSVQIGRICIWTVYEFTTTSLLYSFGSSPCLSKHREEALFNLRDAEWAVENDAHTNWIQRQLTRVRSAFKAVYGFYDDNKNIINPIVTNAAKLLLM